MLITRSSPFSSWYSPISMPSTSWTSVTCLSRPPAFPCSLLASGATFMLSLLFLTAHSQKQNKVKGACQHLALLFAIDESSSLSLSSTLRYENTEREFTCFFFFFFSSTEDVWPGCAANKQKLKLSQAKSYWLKKIERERVKADNTKARMPCKSLLSARLILLKWLPTLMCYFMEPK